MGRLWLDPGPHAADRLERGGDHHRHRPSLFLDRPAGRRGHVGIPLVVAYAVVKHRVFDIKVVVRRGVRYLLARRALQVAVALPAIALAYIVFSQRHLTVTALVTETRRYLYWLGAAGLMLRFRRSIESWLDRRFFREEYDRERLVLELLEDVRKVESMSELSRLASDRLASALHPSSVHVWYREPDELAAVCLV